MCNALSGKLDIMKIQEMLVESIAFKMNINPQPSSRQCHKTAGTHCLFCCVLGTNINLSCLLKVLLFSTYRCGCRKIFPTIRVSFLCLDINFICYRVDYTTHSDLKCKIHLQRPILIVTELYFTAPGVAVHGIIYIWSSFLYLPWKIASKKNKPVPNTWDSVQLTFLLLWVENHDKGNLWKNKFTLAYSCRV